MAATDSNGFTSARSRSPSVMKTRKLSIREFRLLYAEYVAMCDVSADRIPYPPDRGQVGRDLERHSPPGGGSAPPLR
jgi:hypothetical protein